MFYERHYHYTALGCFGFILYLALCEVYKGCMNTHRHQP